MRCSGHQPARGLCSSQRSRARFTVLLLALGLAGCTETWSPTAERDIYLRCSGSITFIGSDSYTRDNQTIAAHIKGSKISFSGNDFLGGRDIPFCRTSPDGTPLDDAYHRFDSDPCGPTTTGNDRTYGTYYWVLGKLDLSHTSSATPHIVQGRFQCNEVAPER